MEAQDFVAIVLMTIWVGEGGLFDLSQERLQPGLPHIVMYGGMLLPCSELVGAGFYMDGILRGLCPLHQCSPNEGASLWTVGLGLYPSQLQEEK